MELAILSASRSRDVHELRPFIEARCNFNFHDGPSTPLMQAVASMSVEVAGLLLAAGADPNFAAADGGTPLTALLDRAGVVVADQMAVLLIRAGLRFDAPLPNNPNSYLTHHFARNPHPSVSAPFVLAGADVNVRTIGGNTPLHVLASEGISHARLAHLYEQTAEQYLCAGADVNARNDAGDTPLHLMSVREYFWYRDLRQLLISKGADLDAQNCLGQTPLHSAALHGKKCAVNLVLAGARVDLRDAQGRTPSMIRGWAELTHNLGKKEKLR